MPKDLQKEIANDYDKLRAVIQAANTPYNKRNEKPQQKGRKLSALDISSPVVFDPSKIESKIVPIKLNESNKTTEQLPNADATREAEAFSIFHGSSADSQNTIQNAMVRSDVISQQQSIVRKKPLGGKKVAPPTVPTNSTTNNPVLSAVESPQTIGNSHSEKTPKEKWLSLIDKKCPRKDKTYSTYHKNPNYYVNANLDILKETIRNLRDKVKCTTCPIANFSGVEITTNDKKVLDEITEDFKKEIKRNEKILKKEEKRIKKFNKSQNSLPKSIFTKLLDLLHISKGQTR